MQVRRQSESSEKGRERFSSSEAEIKIFDFFFLFYLPRTLASSFSFRHHKCLTTRKDRDQHHNSWSFVKIVEKWVIYMWSEDESKDSYGEILNRMQLNSFSFMRSFSCNNYLSLTRWIFNYFLIEIKMFLCLMFENSEHKLVWKHWKTILRKNNYFCWMPSVHIRDIRRVYG